MHKSALRMHFSALFLGFSVSVNCTAVRFRLREQMKFHLTAGSFFPII